MKKYKEYMDGVRASDTLHQRLLGLEASGKRPIPWAKYGTAAAALVLVCGLGAWGLGRGGWEAIQANFKPLETYCVEPEIADAAQPDIAPEDPDEVGPQGNSPSGYGYTIITDFATYHYDLPNIKYGEAEGSVSLDWDIPAGAVRQPLTEDEIITLMGGICAVYTHLNWADFDLSGWAAWYEDGTFWGAYLNGVTNATVPGSRYFNEINQFEFAVTADQLPPTCIAYPESVTQEILGVTVTADGYDFEQESVRRVSFMKDGCGYRFEVSSNGDDRVQQTEFWVSYLVRVVVEDGLNLASLTGTELCWPADDSGYSVGEPNWEDSGADTTAYDPHAYNAPAAYTCEFCGQVVPAPGTYICPNCGEAVPLGAEHTPEVCGLPLAPGTQICEFCGERLPAGANYSHNEDHH